MRLAGHQGEGCAATGGHALRASALKVMGNNSVVAERRSQHGETLTFGWEGPVSDPDRLVSVTSEVGDSRRLPRCESCLRGNGFLHGPTERC